MPHRLSGRTSELCRHYADGQGLRVGSRERKDALGRSREQCVLLCIDKSHFELMQPMFRHTGSNCGASEQKWISKPLAFPASSARNQS